MDFKFLDNKIKLNINGHDFEMIAGDVEGWEALTRAEVARLEVTEDDPSGLRKQCMVLSELFDALLGQGAHDKIFAGRPLNIREHLDLKTHVLKEHMRFAMEREKMLMGNNAEPIQEAVKNDTPEG